MSIQVYGCNHVAIEVDDLAKAQAFMKTYLASNLRRVAKVRRSSNSGIISFSR